MKTNSIFVDTTVPGDGHNDSSTSKSVGTGAVTVNVVLEARVDVDHTISLNEEDGAVVVSEYPGTQ